MNYYVTQITRTEGASATAILTTEKATENEARMLYHQTMASIYATSNIEFFLVYLEDERGTKLLQENYKKPEPVPEPEPEPEEESEEEPA